MPNLQIRIDDDLRDQAQQIAQGMGMDLTTAVRVFLKQIVNDQGFPFRPDLTTFDQSTEKRPDFVISQAYWENDKISLVNVHRVFTLPNGASNISEFLPMNRSELGGFISVFNLKVGIIRLAKNGDYMLEHNRIEIAENSVIRYVGSKSATDDLGHLTKF